MIAEKEFKAITYEGPKGTWSIFSELCKGCGLCIEKCPFKALSWSEDLGVYGTPMPVSDQQKCTACGICQMFCPDCAITVNKAAA